MDRDAQLARLAATQHNAFTADQAFKLEFSRSAIDRRVRSGRWVVLHRGVYAIAGAPGSARQRLMAAALATDGVVSHTSAAFLHGVFPELSLPVHVTGGRRRRKGITAPTTPLGERDVKRKDGIPVTSINRTVVDLAQVLPPHALAAALDDAVQLGLTTYASVAKYRAGQKTPRTLTKLFADRAKGAMQKELERMFARKAKAAGLPRYERQHKVGERKIDVAYPALGIAIELDGFGTRGTPAALRYDTRRQNEIVLAGWRIFLRFTWDQVKDEWPYVETTIRRALAESA